MSDLEIMILIGVSSLILSGIIALNHAFGLMDRWRQWRANKIDETASSNEKEALSDPNFRELDVVLLSGNEVKSFGIQNYPIRMEWIPFVNAFCALAGLPQKAGAYRLFDRENQQWLDNPSTVGDIPSDRIALIHKEDATNLGNDTWTIGVVVK